MSGFEPAIVLIASAFFLSLVIERLLEILKSLYDVLEGKYDGYKFWNAKAESLQRRFEALLTSESVQNLSSRLGYDRLKLEEIAYAKGVTISVSVLRTNGIKYAAKCIGIAMGILIALFLDIDLFHLVDVSMYGETASVSRFSILANIVTGVAMGLGSGPIHKFVSALEKAKKGRKAVK